jgi:hypothetical protein
MSTANGRSLFVDCTYCIRHLDKTQTDLEPKLVAKLGILHSRLQPLPATGNSHVLLVA